MDSLLWGSDLHHFLIINDARIEFEKLGHKGWGCEATRMERKQRS
jgi:hypothetical protein